jgi:putative oxidoreductase
VSTENDRPTYSTSGSSGLFDGNEYSDAPTTILPGSFDYEPVTEEPPGRKPPGWHAGADLGLLVLRLVVGAMFIAHALQHLFGWFAGDGINGMSKTLSELGYNHTPLLAWITGFTELVGGVLVLLGLFTPIGAAALLGLMANVIITKFNGHLFAGDVELESVYAAAAFTLLFAGPGRVSLDRSTPWYRNVLAFGVVFFVIAAGVAVTMLLVFR